MKNFKIIGRKKENSTIKELIASKLRELGFRIIWFTILPRNN